MGLPRKLGALRGRVALLVDQAGEFTQVRECELSSVLSEDSAAAAEQLHDRVQAESNPSLPQEVGAFVG